MTWDYRVLGNTCTIYTTQRSSMKTYNPWYTFFYSYTLYFKKIDLSGDVLCALKMVYYTAIFVSVCMYATLFGVGCWEANLARQHEPSRHSSPGFIHGYVYAIFACVTNIMVGISLLCMVGMYDPKKEDKKEASPASLTCIIAIWSIVLFAGMIDDDIRTGPFQPVVIAQFAITMCGLFLCCCSCIGLMCLNKIQEKRPVNEIRV